LRRQARCGLRDLLLVGRGRHRHHHGEEVSAGD
jgi:hypothetical protein